MAESSKAGRAPTAQKKKFYKFNGVNGRGGRGGGRGGGGFRGGRSSQAEGSGETKAYPMDRYRLKPLPDVMNHAGISATTVKGKERDAERELVERLEEVADELYPDTIEAKVKEEGDDEMDFEELLQKELNTMSNEEKSKRFQVCRYDTTCVSYINVLPPLDPTKLVGRILERIEETGKTPFKFIQRLVPISGVSQATLPLLASAAKPVIEAGFRVDGDASLKFKVISNSRNSDKMERMAMIKTVAEQVDNLKQGHKVDLSNPDRTILVELFKNMVGISVVQDYDRFKKFNTSHLAETIQKGRHEAVVSSNEAEAATTIPAVDAPAPTVEGSIIPATTTGPKTADDSAQVDIVPSTLTTDGPSSNSENSKHQNRIKRVQSLATDNIFPPPKRKAENSTAQSHEPLEELEKGEIIDGVDVDGDVGGEGVEVITGGRAVKIRKTE